MYTNKTDIPLTFAIWLAADHGYDLKFDPQVVTATELLRPMRSIILSRQLAEEQSKKQLPTRDIAEKAATSLGTAVHNAVEYAWVAHHRLAMENLGFDPQAIDRIVVNPKNPCADDLNVYFEMRTSKQIEGYTLSGKFDLVVAGCVHDIKTTKAYTYQNGSNDEKYRMQGSIYRWLNPELITQNSIIVDYYFTDWNPVSYAKEKDKNYPPNRMLAKSFQLVSISETESFIRAQLKKIRELTNKSQDELPRCTPEELWQKPSCWEYWSKAENKQCSKLLDSKADAEAWLASKGVGFIRERQGQPTFCKYCDAQTICKQAQEFVNQGLLVI